MTGSTDDFISNYTRAYIDLNVLKSNYSIISRLAPNSECVCVVKADAYGHGSRECSRALYEAGAHRFAVANIGEALTLRSDLGVQCEILILGHTPPEYAGVMCSNNITQNIYSKEYADMLKCFVPNGERLKVHLKIDTGMNRLGFSCDERGFDDALYTAKQACFYIEGAFTHFACADEPYKNMTDIQLKKYLDFVTSLKTSGIEVKFRHAAASSAIINYPNSCLELVRPGVILYGMQPSDTMADIGTLGLRHVMSLKTRVTNIHTVHKGESISYGASYTAEHDILAATLPIGYGDGFIRAYGGMSVIIKGKKHPIIGRICMDQCMADITDSDVRLLDEVTVFGEGNQVEDFAAHAHTITYECTCILTPRVKRVYSGGGNSTDHR